MEKSLPDKLDELTRKVRRLEEELNYTRALTSVLEGEMEIRLKSLEDRFKEDSAGRAWRRT